MHQGGRFHYPAFLGKLEPVWNVIVQRAFPLTIGVTTIQTAIRLLLYIWLTKILVYLNKLCLTQWRIMFFRVVATHLDKLKIVTHAITPLLRQVRDFFALY